MISAARTAPATGSVQFNGTSASKSHAVSLNYTYVRPPLPFTGFDASGTIVTGDSITNRWHDFPNRHGLEEQQACVIRLSVGTLISAHPSATRLLIEAGTDDILQGPGSGISCNLVNQGANSSILDMIRSGQARGLDVYVMSVLPMSPYWHDRGGNLAGPLVAPFDAALQKAIVAGGAHWVDGYDAFNGHPEYQVDGIHPTLAGYHLLETLYAATICTVEKCGSSQTTSALTPQTVTIPAGTTSQVKVMVASQSGSATPGGTVQLLVNSLVESDVYQSTVLLSSVLGGDGTATFTLDSGVLAPGSYTIETFYAGDSSHLMSWSQLVNVTTQ